MSSITEPRSQLEAFLTALGESLPDDITFRIGGEEELARNDLPPRVVCEPTTRVLGGGKVLPPEPGARTPQRTLFTRAETVRLHMWGDTMAQAEELEAIVFNKLVNLASWSAVPTQGFWVNPSANERGHTIVQDMVVEVPLLRREKFAPLTIGAITTEIEGT